MTMNVSSLAESQIRVFNHQNRNVRSSDEPITFKKVGLIPAKQFLWQIPEWITRGEPAPFLTLENIRSRNKGGFFFRVDKTFGSKFIIKQNCPGTAKTLMGYILDRDMSEGEILQAASDLRIRRLQIDHSGVQIFTKPANQSVHEFLKSNLTKEEVDAHDFFRIAHMHQETSENYGLILPIHTHFHFFPDILRIDEESEKIKLTATHASLRATKQGLIASASRFSPNHVWKKGDVCVFGLHEGMRPKFI